MELLQMKYFVEVAKSGSLTRTAGKFVVTPSAVSVSIKRLENELGLQLFDRVGRGLQLNKYGKAYLKYMEQALSTIEYANEELSELKGEKQRKITFCATNPKLWEDVLMEFHHKHPEIYVKQMAYDTGTMRSREISLEFDFIVASPDSINDPSLDSQLLFDNPLYLAVPKSHLFAGRQTIDLSEAKNEYFVNSLADTSFREYCDALCLLAGFKPKSRMECDYLLRPKILEQENMVCITTRQGQLAGIFDNCSLIRIVSPPCSRPQALFWHRDRFQSNNFKEFKNFVVKYYENHKQLQS